MTTLFQGKGTFFFAIGRSGWSESYFLTGADYSSCATQMLDIAPLRLAMLQLDISLVHCNVSNVYLRGDSFNVPGAVGMGLYPTSPEFMPTDYSIQVNWQSGPYDRNKTFLRGFPLEQQTDGAFIPTSGFVTAFNAWESSVVANCVVKQYVVNPTPPPALVYAYNPITGGVPNFYLSRRKSGRPFGLPRGRLIAP